MAFGFGKKNKSSSEAPVPFVSEADTQDAENAGTEIADAEVAQPSADAVALPPDPADTVYERDLHGPLDVDEIETTDGYVDLGALMVTPLEGLSLRLEVEENTQRVIAVTLDLNGSSLQLQAFAASRSEPLWRDIREQIGLSVGAQGGEIEILDGTFGKEVLAKVPAQSDDGSRGFRVARFIGVDGPRWFLRGVLGGAAAVDSQAALPLEDLFRGVVVVRGEVPLPPRDLLLLRLPKDAMASAPATSGPDMGSAQGGSPLERGPEITTIG
ncbi:MULTISPECIES: DUF3710 domain-containing protein [Arthrobacter]|uniref:DUF3710 domain-containing protein n=1 Tax=Arthrobacter psychrochitiniphilus TaxID=291045 RepID=A0A2V3DRT1_9MICC|nr:DUF3710 domain-containing protein [Arthrobacter psychrochitiniphilus]NYG17236.1 hypothetical protein [Arthrobacter psychrochitiniphilus]PXA65486.1 DUF3710 domain-containing protein [Arthrobacter psychrochitiniphilus]